MRVKVQLRDGSVETISIVPPVTIQHGTLDVLKCADGTEHFFTNDGEYNGWGRSVNMTMEQAQDEIQKVEDSRGRDGG